MNNVINKYKRSLREDAKIIIECRLSPQAKSSEIKEAMSDGSLKVRVSSAPEKGKANLELRNIISQHFEVPLNNVKILKGHKSRLKKISISK
jgi:uncharacterized protein (TIGR00251 family)